MSYIFLSHLRAYFDGGKMTRIINSDKIGRNILEVHISKCPSADGLTFSRIYAVYTITILIRISFCIFFFFYFLHI